MAYDDGLAHRVREELCQYTRVEEREMFGGIGFMLDENMCCGVIDDRLIARVGPDSYESALEKEHASEFDFTGRPMRGWVFVDQQGLQSQQDLAEWVDACIKYVNTLSAES